MPAESIFDPIPPERIRQARARLAYAGLSVPEWAQQNGFKAKAVYDVLGGRKAVRGTSLQIAVKLGLRPSPHSPAPPTSEGLPVDPDLPAGRIVGEGPPVPHRNRRPVSQLGEAVR